MQLFEERIDTINYLLDSGKVEEAFTEYKSLVLMINRLNIEGKLDMLKKTKTLGDKILLKIFKRRINENLNLRGVTEFRNEIEHGKFHKDLKKYQEVCELIDKEDYTKALKIFEDVRPKKY